MALTRVDTGLQSFPDFNRNQQLANAQIYIGVPGLDPAILANQYQAYVVQEDGTQVAVSQPVRTSAGGVPTYLGSPAQIGINEASYSVKVLNSLGSQIYYIPDSSEMANYSTNASAVIFDPEGVGAQQTNAQAKLREWRSLLDFHDPADGSDYTNSLLAAIDSGYPIRIPDGTYSISTLASTRIGSLTLEGSSPATRSGANTIIEFTDDGTGTGIGLDLSSFNVLKLRNLQFKCTGVVDGRSAIGDFVGIRSISASASRVWRVHDCYFTGFSTAAIDTQSMIDCRFDNVNFNRCDNGLRARSGFFPVAGTTCLFINGYNTQNNYAHDIGSMSQSHWMDVVFENNLRGINGSSGTGNSVQDCYGESNTEYTAFWSASAAVLFLDNYSNASGDGYVNQASTGSFGFDAIGSTIVNRNGITTRILEMYNRDGALSERIKASNTSFSGVTVIEDSAGVVQGAIPKMLASQNTGVADRVFKFLIRGTTAQGVPSGWTVTRTGTGTWTVDWPSPLTGNTRWPFIHAQGIPAQSNAVSGGQVDIIALIRARDSSSLWSGFNNMNVGFEIRIYQIDPATGIMTLDDEGAFVEVAY